MWNDAVVIFQKYMGTGLIVIWFLAALAFLYFTEKQKERRIFFIYIPVTVLLIYFNPLFYNVFFRLAGSEIYFRICWMLPVIPVIAYASVRLIERVSGKWQIIYSLLVIGFIMISGRLVYTNPLYSPAENKYHVPQSVVEICDEIHVPGREVMAVFPPELILYVRQYDPTICMPYGRDFISVDTALFREQMEAEVYHLEELAPYVATTHCHFVILSEQKEILGNPQDYGWENIKSTLGYTIYRVTSEPLVVPEI